MVSKKKYLWYKAKFISKTIRHIWYVKVSVTQPHLTFCNPMDCSPPGSSVHGILQVRILEWVAIPFSRESSWPRDWTCVSPIAGRFFTIWATRKALSSGALSQPHQQGPLCWIRPHSRVPCLLGGCQSTISRGLSRCRAWGKGSSFPDLRTVLLWALRFTEEFGPLCWRQTAY